MLFSLRNWRVASESGINSRGGINSSREETRLSEIAFKYPFTDQITRIEARRSRSPLRLTGSRKWKRNGISASIMPDIKLDRYRV